MDTNKIIGKTIISFVDNKTDVELLLDDGTTLVIDADEDGLLECEIYDSEYTLRKMKERLEYLEREADGRNELINKIKKRIKTISRDQQE